MGNPLFSGGRMAPTPGGGNVFQRFQQFRQSFQGDPRQTVQQMVQSGQVSQERYNQAVQMAQQFQNMMGGKL